MPRGRLEVRWGARRIGEGLEDDLTNWLDSHPDATLVAIDTLQRVRARTNGKRNAYEVDVEDLGRLQAIFRDRRVALLIVHHANKACKPPGQLNRCHPRRSGLAGHSTRHPCAVPHSALL